MLLKTSFPYTGGFLCCPNKMVRFTAGLGISGGVDAAVYPDGRLRSDGRERGLEPLARCALCLLGAAFRELLVVDPFLCLGTASHRVFLAYSAACARCGDGVLVRKDPSHRRKTEHSVFIVAGFRRRVEYFGIHFKQMKRFRLTCIWFAGQFFVKTNFFIKNGIEKNRFFL